MGEALLQPGNLGTGNGTTPIQIFTSGDGECYKETITLKINPFSEYLEMSNDELAKNGVTFVAGICIMNDGKRSRATWKYYFQHSKIDGVDWVGGFLHLKTQNSRVKSARAWYSVTLSSEGKDIQLFKMPERKQFATAARGWGCEELVKKSELLEMAKATDELEVTLNVKVFANYDFKPVLQAPPPSSSELVQLRGRMALDLVKMLESGVDANVEIKVPNKAGGEVDESSYTRKVHKSVLVARSTVFETMFAPESKTTEAQTGKVVIKDLSPKGLDIFLHYLYTGEVLHDWVQVIPEILKAAKNYNCGALKQFCGHNLLPAVTTTNAFKMWKLANRHNLSFAVMGIKEFILKNAKVVITKPVIDEVSDNVDGE